MIVTDLFESHQTCPKCGGPAFSDLVLAEKKDACYSKVRSRYKVWPSAYASGALVQCRKKGADNYGNSKNEGVAEGSDDDIWGPRGNFAGDKHVDIGGVTMKIIQVGDTVKYLGQQAKVVGMSKDRKYSRISIGSGFGGSVKDVLTADLKQLGQGVAEGKMAELEMDLEDPEITDRQFEKMYGMTRKEAREQFSQTDMWAFPEIRDPNRPLHERGVAEAKTQNKQVVGFTSSDKFKTWEQYAQKEGYEIREAGNLPGSYAAFDDNGKRVGYFYNEFDLPNGYYYVGEILITSEKQGVAEGLNEMDKTQTPPGRDGDIDWTKKQIHLGPEHVIKAKDVAKHALKALDKTMKKSHADTPKKKGVAEAGPVQGEYSRVLTALRLYYPRFEMEELNTPEWYRVIANKANVTPEYAGQVIDDFVKASQPDEEENLDWMDDTNDVREGVAEAGYGHRNPDLMSPGDYDRYQQDQMDHNKRDFKRREHEAEWEQEKAYSEKLAARDAGTWYIRINGKLLKDRQGQPYTFQGKAAANRAAATMMAKPFNAGKQFTLTTTAADRT